MAFRNEEANDTPRFGVLPEDVIQRRQLIAEHHPESTATAAALQDATIAQARLAERQRLRAEARLGNPFNEDVAYGEVPYTTDPAIDEGRGFVIPTFRVAPGGHAIELNPEVFPELLQAPVTVTEPVTRTEFEQMLDAMRHQLRRDAAPPNLYAATLRPPTAKRCAKCNAKLGEADVTAAKCLQCGAFYNTAPREPVLIQCDLCDAQVPKEQLRVGYSPDGIEYCACRACRHAEDEED